MPKNIATYSSATLLILLFLLAWLVGGSGFGADLSAMRLAAEARAAAPALVQTAELWTRLGGAAVTLPVAALAALILHFRHRSAHAALLIVIVLGERALVDGLKQWLGRPRPAGGEYLIESMAFPSAHAANSMTVYLAIAILAAPPASRRQLAAAAIFLSLTIGLTRILLGVHWPSDVIGGWALGLATVWLAIAAAHRSGALPLEAKHEVVGRHGDPAGENKAP